MPGYYVHLAATNPKLRRNNSFMKGVIMPDLLKAYVRKYGLVKTKKKYNEFKTPDMPDFSFFENRIKSKDDENEEGMHYGASANPNITGLLNSLTEEERNNPFYRGYVWHLLTDYYTYQTLRIFSDIDIGLLHEDWDRINVYINVFYPDVELPREVRDLGMVSYIDDNIFNYVDPINIKFIIDHLQSFDALNGDIDLIINEIKDEVEQKKSSRK